MSSWRAENRKFPEPEEDGAVDFRFLPSAVVIALKSALGLAEGERDFFLLTPPEVPGGRGRGTPLAVDTRVLVGLSWGMRARRVVLLRRAVFGRGAKLMVWMSMLLQSTDRRAVSFVVQLC